MRVIVSTTTVATASAAVVPRCDSSKGDSSEPNAAAAAAAADDDDEYCDGGNTEDDDDDDATLLLTKTIIDSWYQKIVSSHSSADRRYHTLCHLEEMFDFLDLLRMNDDGGGDTGESDTTVPSVLMDDVKRRSGQETTAQHCIEYDHRKCDDDDDDNDAVVTMAVFFHDIIYNARSGTNEEDSATCYQTFVTELQRASMYSCATGGGGGGDNSCTIINDDETKPTPMTTTTTTGWSHASNTVVQFILATKTHTIPSSSNDDDDTTTSTTRKRINRTNLIHFLDADMAVLGKQPNAYDHYAALIRQEYQHVPHDVYCDKRADILESFLVIGGGGGSSSGDTNNGGDEIEKDGTTIFMTDAMKESFEDQAVANLRREIDTLRKGVIPSLSFSLL